MQVTRYTSAAFLGVIHVLAQGAQAASPAPPFDVAYRAWEVVTELARHNGGSDIAGECGRTFRPFVIPGLRRQSRQEEDVAAAACLDAARRACTNSQLRKSAEAARKCEEFR
jgi:hypothetical protein